MNYPVIHVIILLNLIFFVPLIITSSVQANQITNQGIITQELPNVNQTQDFIIGIWRGFHEAEGKTMYYGYVFRQNQTFLARHRVYQGEITIYDQFWQGKWQFEGNILFLEGVSQNNTQTSLKLQFRLDKDLKFYYQEGSSSIPYIPLSLGKSQ
ncbi:hypothetical protein [Aphanothece sacrum]|uniref:Uncharacterized protein n=1 Tax=Aphanothece sacrum FPU1 TaxID=1920663 RepID=A0A401IHX6_APHSA|nr:hypothetical protein [Aphanothece sacrum]GBF80902.1 hypothetical protein AsFPU1_2311 [Aphanothece sacrum FPU1]GBF85209.1 hypothetical protein AsFPU3_2268 [Aphanothece sacrum FPU3]